MPCSKKEILRKRYYVKGYTRKDGTVVKGHYVAATCVPDKGSKGKTPVNKQVLPKLQKGLLTQYGYSTGKSDVSRHKALKEAATEGGYLPILRRVVVIANYNKHNKDVYAKLRNDVEWLKKQYKKSL